MEIDLQNPNPQINNMPYQLSRDLAEERIKNESDPEKEDLVDKYEIYEIIRNINDPEHPLTLEQINVVNVDNIYVDNEKKRIKIYFTPTIPNCTMSAVIGLSIKVKLLNTVSRKYKVDVLIEPGKHMTEDAINKQLCDKERVYAALEAEGLKRIIGRTIKNDEKFYSVYQ